MTAKEALVEWAEGPGGAEAAAELRRMRPGACLPEPGSLEDDPLLQLLVRTRARPLMTEEEWNRFAANLEAERVSFGNFGGAADRWPTPLPSTAT